MGRQSSRIIWGKTKKNPKDTGYNLVEITDYDEENIYTSGNIVIANEYGQDEEGYRAYQCIASEAGGEFSTYDTWKLLPGIITLVSYGYIPDTKSAEKVIYTRRYMFKPGSKIIKKSLKDGCHYLYKCIEENNVHFEGWVPDKWEKQLQRVGVAYIPRDHKDVYYDNGRNATKWHKAMWYMPEESDNKYVEEIGFYDGSCKVDEDTGNLDYTTEYFKGERVIYNGKHPNEDELWVYEYQHNTFIGGIAPDKYYYIELWKHIEDIEVYEINKLYKKGDMVIAYYEENLTRPISDYSTDITYISDQYCLRRIKPDESSSVTTRDKEALIGYWDQYAEIYISDYIKEETFPEVYKYTPNTSRGRRIETNGPIYGAYVAISDTSGSFNEYKWLLIPDIRHWDECLTIVGEVIHMPYGRKVIWNITDSSDMTLYECIKDHTIIIPENQYETTDDYLHAIHKPDTNPEYWRPLYQYHQVSNTYKVYKAVRNTSGQFNKADWVVVTQQKHDNLNLWGYIWKKLGDVKGGGIPFFGILPVYQYLGITNINVSWNCQIRLDELRLYLGNNILRLGQVLSCNYSSSTKLITGGAFSNVVQVGNSIYGYLSSNISSTLDSNIYCNYIVVFNKNREFKRIILNNEELYYRPGNGFNYGLCSNNIILYVKRVEKSMGAGNYLYDSVIKKITVFPSTSTYLISDVTRLIENEVDGVHAETIIGGIRYRIIRRDNKFYTLFKFNSINCVWMPEDNITSDVAYAFYNAFDTTNYTYIDATGNIIAGPKYLGLNDVYIYGDTWKKIMYLPYVYDLSFWKDYLDNVGYINRITYLRSSIWPYVRYLTNDDKAFLTEMGASYNEEGTQFVIPYLDILDNEELETRPIPDGEGGYVHFERDPAVSEIQIPVSDGNSYHLLRGFFAPYKSKVGQYMVVNLLVLSTITMGACNTYEIINVHEQMATLGPYTNMGYFLGDLYNTVFFYTDSYCLFYISSHGAQAYISSGIWKLDFNSRELLRLYNPLSLESLYDLYKSGCIWKIPYYRNQTCNIKGSDLPEEGLDIEYLILHYGKYTINEYDTWAENIPIRNGELINGVWNVSIILPKLTPNLDTDTGNPVSYKNDLTIVTTASINYQNVNPGVVLCVALPNFRSNFENDHMVGGFNPILYDPIINGAFFWITSTSWNITPKYGGPENDADGFSGW